MDKRGKVVVSVVVLFVLLVSISLYSIFATESNVKIASLEDAGYSGFVLVVFITSRTILKLKK